mgnify:CR=1 FL=1
MDTIVETAFEIGIIRHDVEKAFHRLRVRVTDQQEICLFWLNKVLFELRVTIRLGAIFVVTRHH